MGDAGGVLSKFGYKSTWIKLKEVDSPDSRIRLKSLTFACEKRFAGGKIWIGRFCSMAMAAHAFDLIAEVLGWPGRHYERSDLLVSKAEELKQDVGDDFDAMDPSTRRKLCDHASRYASLFPCSDSRQTLLSCFQVWDDIKDKNKDSNFRCLILVEIPQVNENPAQDRFYPDSLLPPVAFGIKRGEYEYDPWERFMKRGKKAPRYVLGTREMREEMNVEPDIVECMVDEDPDARGETSGVPYFYQQWTWCTRSAKNELSQRRWNAPRVPYPSSTPTTFHEAPMFATGSKESKPFSFLNYQIYHNVKSAEARHYPICKWTGTSMEKYEAPPTRETTPPQ